MTTQELQGARYLHIAIPYDREWDEYHLNDDEKRWVARQLAEGMVDLRGKK